MSSTVFGVASLAVLCALCAVHPGAAVAAQAASASGTVSVQFIDVDQYRDAGRTAQERERTTQQLAIGLERLGQRLPAGQDLRLEVLDVDLAGRIDSFVLRGAPDLRVATGGADWPRVVLRYTLVQDGTTVQSGTASVSDMAYLQRSIGRSISSHDRAPLPHEMRMLERWFSARFVQPAVN